MSASTAEFARLLPIAFRSVIRLVAVEMDKNPTGLSLAQFGVLDFLLTNSQAVQTDLANHFVKDKSVMLRQLDEMEKSGWIERQMDPHDRRRKNLVVTKLGMEVYNKVSKLRARVFEQVLVGVSEQEIATCFKVFQVLNDKANSGDSK